MKKALFIVLGFTILGCARTLTTIKYTAKDSEKGIYYNLPKSIIKLEIQYTLYRDYNLLKGKKVYTSTTYAKIENPVTITSVAIPDEENRYLLTYKKNNSNYFFEDSYTVEMNANGTLKAINWETENVIPDIASNILSSGLNIFKTLSPASDESEIEEYLNIIKEFEKEVLELDKKIKTETSKGNLKKVKELKELQNIIISRVDKLKTLNKKGQKDKVTKSETIYLNLEKEYSKNEFITKNTDTTKNTISFIIDLKSNFKGIDEESFPKLVFHLPINTVIKNNNEGLKYRVPKRVNYQLTLIDSNDIDYPQRTIASSDITIIQYGDINVFPLKVKGSKKSKIALTLDENTGLITKVSNTSNSILKESSSLLKSSTEEVYKTFDNYSFNKKKKDLENEKSLLELQNSIETVNKDEVVVEISEIEKQIAELKLLLEKLEIERKIRELEESSE